MKWVIERIEGKANGRTTPIGIVPTADDLDLSDLDVDKSDVDAALAVNVDEWRQEIPLIEEWFESARSSRRVSRTSSTPSSTASTPRADPSPAASVRVCTPLNFDTMRTFTAR